MLSELGKEKTHYHKRRGLKENVMSICLLKEGLSDNKMALGKYQTCQSHFSPRQFCGFLNLPNFTKRIPSRLYRVERVIGCMWVQPHRFDTLKDCYLDSRKNGRAYDGSGVATAKRGHKRVSKLPMMEVELFIEKAT